MIAAFVDEGGNDPNSKVFAMAAILVTYSDAYHFANAWRGLLERENLAAFHATDFYGGRNEFSRDRGWSRVRSAAFENEILTLLDDWQVQHSGVLVPNQDYTRAYVDSGFHKSLIPATSSWKKPYLHAFQQTIIDLRSHAEHLPSGHFINPVFDGCQEFMGQAKVDYERKNRDRKLGRIKFSSSFVDVELQAADFMCWHYRISFELFLSEGEFDMGPVLTRLRRHSFGAKIWTFEFLDYLRRRVQAVECGDDPEKILR